MNEYDDLTTQLTQSLTDHSDAMAGSSLGLADVQGRARSIRRRRTAASIAGAAAAVALLVPTVALASHSNATHDEPGPATQTPSTTQTASAHDGRQPAPGVLDVSHLPTGEAPQVEYVTDGQVLHQIDGSTADIGTQHRVSSFAVLKDGTHVWQTADDQGHAYVQIQDATGSLHSPVPSTFGLSISRSHDAAAWIDPQGQVRVVTPGATEGRALGDPVSVEFGARISAFGSDDCVKGHCSVFVNVSGGNAPGEPWEVGDAATRPFTDGHMQSVADLSGGVFIGYTKVTEDGSCSTLWGGGEFQGFTTCAHTLSTISPDGGLVLGIPAYLDGFGNGSLAMYDATGGEVLFQRASTTAAQSSYQSAVWEDDSHVLASFFQEGSWSVVRVAPDGSMEYAVAPIDGSEQNPYVLPTT